MDKLRILLLDDMPTLLMDSQTGDVRLPRRYEESFHLWWVQNAVEGKWLLEAFEIFAAQDPRAILNAGLPPEILIFDYALTQGGDYRRETGHSSHICMRVSACLEERGIAFPPPPNERELIDTGALPGSDRTGCYLGGEFARTFGSYPCGAVPTTAHIDTDNSDAKFYEWLNENYFLNLFDQKSRASPEIEDLISTGVRALRQRIEILVGAGLIRISFEHLLRSISAPEEMTDQEIRVVSHRFGARTFAVRALFADYLISATSSPDVDGFCSAARSFGEKLLETAYRNKTGSEFIEARTLANRYYLAWQSEEANDREELSGLARKNDRSPGENKRLAAFCDRLGLDPDVLTSETVDFMGLMMPQRANTLKPIYQATESDLVARWSVLLLAVLVEHHLTGADAEDFHSTLTDEEVLDGEVGISVLIGRLGHNRTEQILQMLSLSPDKEGNIRIPPRRNANVVNIYQAIDPLPENVFIYTSRGKNWQVTYYNYLKRLGTGRSGWGNLGLDVRTILQGDDFSHGPQRGEGNMLRNFADQIGFRESRWPQWLVRAP